MKLGIFMRPSHPPERSLYDASKWDLEVICEADKLGYSEAWIGEHFTAPWEPIPAPDLLIAQAILKTDQIKLAPGAHLLPYHHPVELAHRVAYLDHLSQGRLILGIGSSGLPTDWLMFNVNGEAGENRDMTKEALEIMLEIWKADGPKEYRGKYWDFNTFDPMQNSRLKHHIFPFQAPHPPIGITGLSPNSPTLLMAGEQGFIPVSFGANNEYIASHWDSVLEGAAKSGRNPDRKDWRVTKDILVADTDEEAMELAINGMMAREFEEYFFPLFSAFGQASIFKHHPEVPDEAVNARYQAENIWLVGSPDTVAKKLLNVYQQTGGFGTLLLTGYDYSENPEPWMKSLRLMQEEVLPRFESLLKATV